MEREMKDGQNEERNMRIAAPALGLSQHRKGGFEYLSGAHAHSGTSSE